MTVVIAEHRSSACPDISRLEALATAEGYAFVTGTRLDWDAGSNRFDLPGERFYLAEADGLTVGMCGLNRDPYLDDPAVGRLRHLYVDPSHRRSGVAVALVERCLGAATGVFGQVRLRTDNPAADRLYRSIGFELVDHETATHTWKSPAAVEQDRSS